MYGEVLGYRPLELDLYLPQAGGRRPSSCTCTAAGGGAARAASRCPCWERASTTPWPRRASRWRRSTTGSAARRFPAQLEDVRTAISWVRDHAASYGLDADREFLWGDSAGGHLALLAALTGAKVRGVVAWFAVTDLAGLPSDVADAGGLPDPGPQSREAQLLGAPASSAPDLARQASPATHASASAPPILLMHGAVDDMVPPTQSVRLAEALTAAGATVELELVPGATHFWNGASDVPGIVRRSIEFLRARG